MKKILFTAMLCGFALCLNAQKMTRNYLDQSLSKVLEDLNAATPDQTIYFIYDELEDFTVTTSFENLSLADAVRQVIGFYPMKVTTDGDRIFVECTQKESTKVIGRVVDGQGQPVEFATLSVLSIPDSAFINGSVSNENGDFVIPCKESSQGAVTLKVTCIGYQTLTR